MDKFNFGQYDSTISDGPFQNGSYPTNMSGEQGAKKQLSYPLKELKEYINKTIPIKAVSGVDKAIQLKLTDSNLIQYSLDNETWLDTASGGHQIFDDSETQMPQKTKLMFRNSNVHNSGDYTIVEGIQGAAGVSVSSIVQVSESTTSEGLNVWRATLSNGTTFDFIVRNGHKGEKGDNGEMGRGLIILGTYSTLEDLQQAHPVGNEGDCYIVGTSDSNPAYVWDINDNAWESIGKIRGEKGAKGDTGNTGATGTGIQSITAQETSASGGTNVWTITLTNGAVNTFNVKNGQQGAAGEGMKTGGTAGQILAKHTSVDYDTEWIDPPTIDQSYNASSTNAQSGVAVAQAVSNRVIERYTTVNVPTSNWTSCTYGGEPAYYINLVLGGASSGKHGTFSVKPTKPSTKDAEEEMFGQILDITENTNTIQIISTAIPTTAYVLQASNY